MKKECLLDKRIEWINRINEYCWETDEYACLDMVIQLLGISYEELSDAASKEMISGFGSRLAKKVDESFIYFPLGNNEELAWLLSKTIENKELKTHESLGGKAKKIIFGNPDFFSKVIPFFDVGCVVPSLKIMRLRELLTFLKDYKPEVLLKYKITKTRIILMIYVDGIPLSKENIKVQTRGKARTFFKELLGKKGAISEEKIANVILKAVNEKKNPDEEKEEYKKCRAVVSGRSKVVRELNKDLNVFEKLGLINLSFAGVRLIEDSDFFDGFNLLSRDKERRKFIPKFLREKNGGIAFNYQIDEFLETNDPDFF